MQPEGSLPHSQASATCPYPGPAQSNPHKHTPTSWRSILILSTHLRLGLPSGLFPSGFPTKTLYTPSSHPYAPHVQPISFFSILNGPINSQIHSLSPLEVTFADIQHLRKR